MIMLRKVWHTICDAFGVREKVQLKRSNTDNLLTSEEDSRTPSKRRRIDIAEPTMSSHHKQLYPEDDHLDLGTRKEAQRKSKNPGFMVSSDFINNKENAFGELYWASEARGSREQPIVIDAADESVQIIRGNAPSSTYPTTHTPATQWVESKGARKRVPRGIQQDDDVQPIYQSLGKHHGDSPRFPMPNRPLQGRRHKMLSAPATSSKGGKQIVSDDEVQVLEPVLQRPASMRFATNMYNLQCPWVRSGHSGSLFKSNPGSSSSNASRRNSTSLGRSALDFCQDKAEKMRFQQLLTKVIRWDSKLGHSSKSAANTFQDMRNIPVVTIDEDFEMKEVIEIKPKREYTPTTLASKIADHGFGAKHSFSHSNSVDELIRSSSQYFEDVNVVKQKYDLREAEMREQLKEPLMRAKLYAERNEQSHQTIEERMREYCKVTEVTLKEVVTEPQPPELTSEMQAKIRAALVAYPPNQLLVEAYSLRITRTDMQTLNGLNWLNDEVINLYMELLVARGKEPGFPKVHAFNTFFYPRLLTGGHTALKRWTRRIDLFAQDLVIIPVHLGVHWCMAAVDFRSKKIVYYDSMGHSNSKCLTHLQTYFEEESKDKRKCPWDTKGWIFENKTNIPQQMNGSDCGMFACMYAEYLCRDAAISFTQDDMPYFRRKMCYELLTAKLLPFK